MSYWLNKKRVQLFVVLFLILGTIIISFGYRKTPSQNTYAATISSTNTGVSEEAENGTVSGPATAITGDSSASNNGYVLFNQQSTSTFQPTAPYYATFFYTWYKTPTTDDSWSYWQDLGHTPPNNWFSNYLPDYDTTQFNPSTELYSSNDTAVLYWQLRKLAEAKQEVGISSWWGQNHKSDIAFRNIVTNVMNKSDNPYPNFRWAMYYEKEGDNGNGLANDPSITDLTNDLNYIYTNYAQQPTFLKINGRPVIFAYADANDCSTTNPCDSINTSSMLYRWNQARQQAQGNFYVVLKVFPGYATAPFQPDSWHQYAPAVRTDKQGAYSYMVSPGFWKNGDAIRLSRDLTAFTTAVQNMVADNATWKFVETWNEWGEGSSVEPGDQVIQTTGGNATLDPNGVPFKNNYVNVLNQFLPALEQGTGAQ